jgi:HK97 gp10 family phage protein
MSGEALVKININPNMKNDFHVTLDKAVRDVFNLDILPEAIQNSPVTPEGVEYNQAKFDEKKHRPGTKINPVRLHGTGHNRQSLDVDFDDTPLGTQATLYGQSGYSGYLEVGTSKMRAQPYLWPAFVKFYKKIVDLTRR